MKEVSEAASEHLFATGGKVGIQMQGMDWLQTPLGAIETWSLSLKTTLGILLNAYNPMFLLWGDDRILFYNDAYNAHNNAYRLLQAHHTSLPLGQPVQSDWVEGWKQIEADVNQVFMMGQPVQRENQQWHSVADTTRCFTWSYSAIWDENGQIGGVLAAGHEEVSAVVSAVPNTPDTPTSTCQAELQQAEADAREGETRLRLALSAAKMGTWEVDLHTGSMQFDQTLHQLFGLPVEATVPDRNEWYQCLHPDDRDRVECLFQQAVAGKAEYDVEYRIVGLDGSLHWVISRGAIIRNNLGQPIRAIGVAAEITDRKQSAEALRQSEERFRHMADNAPMMIWVTDSTGSCTYLSQSWYEFTGQTEETGLGMGWLDVVHPEDREIAKNTFRAANDRREALRMEYRLRYKDGKYRWAIDAANPWFDVEGEFRGYIGSVIDITDRKQAEKALQQAYAESALQANQLEVVNQNLERTLQELHVQEEELRIQNEELILARRLAETERQRYQDLFNFAPDGYVVTDANGVIQEVNQAITTLLSYDSMAQMPALLSVYVAESDRRAFRNFLFELHKHPHAQSCELNLKPFEGTPFPTAITAVAIRNDQEQILGIRWLVRDITDRKRAEHEREQLLEREQAAREVAEAANRIKDEFLAVLSHELRSPLNPILGWSKLLQQGKLDATRTNNALATIERNARLQVQLIDDLLDISRILRGKLTLNSLPVHLSFVISAAVETVRLAIDTKAIQLNLKLDPKVGQVVGDAARLQQVVWNLLSNAAKFTPAGGQISVELTQVENHAQLQVKDTGKGIHADFLPHVFEHFRQEDGATTRKFGGLGLGLAIVRQIVELHGGSVRAESPGEGRGATFTVKLPILQNENDSMNDEDEPGAFPIPHSVALPLVGLRILVTDDEADMRQLAEFILEQQGAEVSTASSAQAALTLLDQFTPDILISDIGMPEMDGYMLIRQVRSRATTDGRQIPAIALTAYAGELNQQQALAAGFQRHIAKPVEPDQLVKLIVDLAQKFKIRH